MSFSQVFKSEIILHRKEKIGLKSTDFTNFFSDETIRRMCSFSSANNVYLTILLPELYSSFTVKLSLIFKLVFFWPKMMVYHKYPKVNFTGKAFAL